MSEEATENIWNNEIFSIVVKRIYLLSDLFESVKEGSNVLGPVQFPLLIGLRHHQSDVLTEVGQLQGGAHWVGGVTLCCQYQDGNIQDLEQPRALSVLGFLLFYLL